MDTPAQNPAVQAFDLMATINALDEGAFAVELAEKFQAVVASVHTLGKPGKISITIDVQPAGRTVEITTDIKPKEPAEPKSATIFFVTEKGGLSVRDPKQMALPFTQPGAPITLASLQKQATGTAQQ